MNIPDRYPAAHKSIIMITAAGVDIPKTPPVSSDGTAVSSVKNSDKTYIVMLSLNTLGPSFARKITRYGIVQNKTVKIGNARFPRYPLLNEKPIHAAAKKANTMIFQILIKLSGIYFS